MSACRHGLVVLVVLVLLGMAVGCSESNSPSEPEGEGVLVGFFGVDPAATFFHTCGEMAAGNAEPIILADQGLAPGTSIRIEVVGQFIAGGTLTADDLGAVFSSSGTLLGGGELNRVPDAIDAGEDFVSPPTYACGGEPTDFPQDFLCAPEATVTIPAGATHLFVCALDVYYSDNSDPDEDFGVNIWELE